MGSKATILESLTAAQISSPGVKPPTTLIGQLALSLRINSESDAARPSCGRAVFHKELIGLISTIADIEQSAKSGDGTARSFSERIAAVRVALENTSAAGTATHDPGFAIQSSKLTKAQVLSLIPLRPHINRTSGKRR